VLEMLLTNPLTYVLVAIYAARMATLLLRQLLALRNEWVRRER
jgi:hypothetical protein